MLKKGSTVILTHKLFIATPEYPVWPSRYQCVGTVAYTREDGRIGVKWSNGRKNEFSYHHLTEVDSVDDASVKFKIDPNQAFIQRDM